MTRTTRLALLAASAILPWGASFMINKWLLQELGPASLSLYRWALASGLYLAYLAATGRLRPMWVSLRRKPLVFLALGLLCLPVPYLAQNYAIRLTSIINVSVLLDVDPAFVVVMAAIFLHERISMVAALGVAIAVVGTVVIALAGGGLSLASADFVGNALALTAAGSLAVYTILIKTSAREFDALTLAVLPTLVGTLLLVPPAWAEGLPWPAHPWVWAGVLFLGVVNSAWATWAYIVVVQELDASRAGPLVFLIPVVAAILAVTVVGERPGVQTWVGAALILGGVFLSERNGHAPEDLSPRIAQIPAD
jgi:drug/metabolite transporter (DMT)-like permease